MALTREEVLHLARLARLGLSEDDISKFQHQLSSILEHFQVLRQIDTEDVPPTFHTLALENVMSDDTVRPSWPVERILENAPQREGAFIRVRAVLEPEP